MCTSCTVVNVLFLIIFFCLKKAGALFGVIYIVHSFEQSSKAVPSVPYLDVRGGHLERVAKIVDPASPFHPSQRGRDGVSRWFRENGFAVWGMVGERSDDGLGEGQRPA